MPAASSTLSEYLDHLAALLRARSNTAAGRDLPDAVRDLCSRDPHACLELIVDALAAVDSPHLIQAIGDELLDNLLNEHSSQLQMEIVTLLRTNQRFRFAFASGRHSSVDPAIVAEWVDVLRELGTTKQRERKRLWSGRSRE